MLIGYVRVSKSDDTQTLVPQRDGMLAAGVDRPDPSQSTCARRHSLASVSPIVCSISNILRRTPAPISISVRRKSPLIERPAIYHCASLQLRLRKPLQRLHPLLMRRGQFTTYPAANEPQKQARLCLFCNDPAPGRRGFDVPGMRAARSCRALRRPNKHPASLERDNLGFEVGAQRLEAEPRSGFQLGITLKDRDVRTLLVPAWPRCAVDQNRPDPLRGGCHIDAVMRENDSRRRSMVWWPKDLRIGGL